MVVTQKQSHRKASGGIRSTYKKGRQYEDGSVSLKPVIGETKIKTHRIMGGHTKLKALSFETANVYVPKQNKHKVVKLKTVVENKANINFVRRNILTKGAVVETELGKAKITSRPGQEGIVNAVLLD